MKKSLKKTNKNMSYFALHVRSTEYGLFAFNCAYFRDKLKRYINHHLGAFWLKYEQIRRRPSYNEILKTWEVWWISRRSFWDFVMDFEIRPHKTS